MKKLKEINIKEIGTAFWQGFITKLTGGSVKRKRKYIIMLFVLVGGTVMSVNSNSKDNTELPVVTKAESAELPVITEAESNEKSTEPNQVILSGAEDLKTEFPFNLFYSQLNLKHEIRESWNSLSLPEMGKSTIFNILKIIVALACIYRIFMHYRATDEHRSFESIYGYFNWIGLLLLYVFYDYIYIGVIGAGEQLSASVTNISDYSQLHNVLLSKIEENIDSFFKERSSLSIIRDGMFKSLLDATLEFTKVMFVAIGTLLIEFAFAIADALIFIMAKITTTILVAFGVIPVLLSFIPAFKDLWKGWITNLINVMLWIPIFTFISSICVSLVTTIIENGLDSKEFISGGFLWMAILSVFLAYQSYTMTFQISNALIQGSISASGMALGQMMGLNAVGMAGKAAASSGGMVASTGGAALGTAVAPGVGTTIGGAAGKGAGKAGTTGMDTIQPKNEK